MTPRARFLVRYFLGMVLFCIAWQTLAFWGDEHYDSLAESFLYWIRSLPFVEPIEYPTTFFIAFLVYPILFYIVISGIILVIWRLRKG